MMTDRLPAESHPGQSAAQSQGVSADDSTRYTMEYLPAGDDSETLAATQLDKATPPELATLYVVPYFVWRRDGSLPFETQRARLLDTLSNMLDQMESGLIRSVTFGGGLSMLEDVEAVRPDLLDRLIKLHDKKRCDFGVFYVQTDESLVSGESLLRNLMHGREAVKQREIKISRVAFLPGAGGHVPQLPQILSGFEVSAVFVHHGLRLVHLPFSWAAPDGSTVLVLSADTDPAATFESALREQRDVKPDGPFLWLYPSANVHSGLPPEIPLPIEYEGLNVYIDALRLSLPDVLRPMLRGELRIFPRRAGSYTHSGTLSTRGYLKQANARAESLLIHGAEPLLALALNHGTLSHAENARALLDYAWRMLLRQQSQPMLGGNCSDAVHESQELALENVATLANELIQRGLQALPGVARSDTSPAPAADTHETHLVVWNTHNWHVKQPIIHPLTLPEGKYPAQVLSPGGKEQSFVWHEDTSSIEFLADVPPVGYVAYTIRLSSTPTDESCRPKVYNATHIHDMHGAALMIEHNRLTWRHLESGIEISDLLRFFDGGDAGDTYNYSAPHVDFIEQAQLVGTIQVEESPFYRRLILHHRMRVAPELNANRNRERGLRLLELMTTATFYNGLPGVYFKTTFTNTANDHRLRAHIRSGIRSETLLADASFGMVERKITSPTDRNDTTPFSESYSGTMPMQRVAVIEDKAAGLALLTRGLTEVEGIQEGGQTTLALTLVRAVGWLSRADLDTRRGAVDAVKAVSGAQSLRPITAEYALVPVPPTDHAAMLRAGQTFSAPLIVHQYDSAPEVGRRSYLSVTTGDPHAIVLVTALKPPQEGDGVVLRLLNPNEVELTARFNCQRKAHRASLLTLSEQPLNDLKLSADGSLELPLPPHKLVTLKLEFEE